MLQIVKLVTKKIGTFEYAPRYSCLAGDIAVYEPQLRITNTNSGDKQWAIQSQSYLCVTYPNLPELKNSAAVR